MPLRLALFASFFLISVNANAKTLYLDCNYEQCAASQHCAEHTPLVLHFLIDTTNKKAWRLGSPIARPVKLIMNDEGQLNLLDEVEDGSINVTSIHNDLHSAHSIHPMMANQSMDQVRQYHGICGERNMIAHLTTK